MDKNSTAATKLRKEINQVFLTYEKTRDQSKGRTNKPELKPINDYSELLTTSNANELIEQLLKKIDEWIALQAPGSDDNFMGIIMKATALRMKSQIQTTLAKKSEILYQALNMIKPFGETAKGFYPYMNIMMTLSEWHRNQDENEKANELLFRANEIYNRFISNSEEYLWDYFCIFSGNEPTKQISDQGKWFFKIHLGYNLYNYYKLEGATVDKPEMAQYLVPAIQYSAGMLSPSRMYTISYVLTELVHDLLPLFRFKQLDHSLAGLMFHLVRYRRSLPESDRKEVIALQFRLARTFAYWGALIGNLSATKIRFGSDVNIDNESYEPVGLFLEPGVEVYAHQFPIELVGTLDEIKKINKRVQKWDKKAAELSEEGGVKEKWIAGTDWIVVQLEKNINEMS